MTLDQTLINLRRAQAQRTIRTATAAAAPPGAMIHTIVTANAAGDNILIPPPGSGIAVYEINLWNATGAQTLTLQDGQIPLARFTGFPGPAGITLGFAGNSEPHFRVTAGNALILNLSVGSLVDGFVKYRLTSL